MRNTNTKVCTKCDTEKSLQDFRKSKKYYRSECKECERKYKKQYQKEHGKEVHERRKEKAKLYRELHKEKIKEYQKQYYIEHKEEHKNYSKEYNKVYIRPKESIEKHKKATIIWKQANKKHCDNWRKEYRKTHREQIRKKDIEWRKQNKNKIKIYQQKDYEKRKKDPILRLKRNTRNMLNDAFKKHNYRKSKHTEEILGCKIDYFISHLLQTFKDNYGYEWDDIEKVHIDHITPLNTAETEEEVIKLCHYTNLQLLKENDNLSKGASLDWKLDKK